MSGQPGNGGAENLRNDSSAGDNGPEQRLAEALADYVDLLSREEIVDTASFCKRYPEVEADLRSEIATLQEMDVLADASTRDGADPSCEPSLERLSGHRILGEIGSGGMGRVLLALDERLGRKVAIKTLKARYSNHPILRSRFMHEARAMAKLSHPNIVHIYNLGESQEVPHFVMEYLEGSPLTEAARALPLRQKVDLMQKVVRTVEFVHQHQILHRDLKPGNIVVGADLEPKLLDFGLALQVDDLENRMTRAGDVMGTLEYFSPEQTRGNALDPRSDVFSLGTIFYQVLTGSLPFSGESFAEAVTAIRDQEPILPRRLNSSLPGALQNICVKALEKNPSDRYQSAGEMAQDIERYLAGEEVLALPTSYTRLLAGRIEGHLREVEAWKTDQVVSDSEYDALRKAYGRLSEREDTWIMETRRLSLSQVTLYLGAWVLVVGAALVFLFQYSHLSGMLSVLVVDAAAIPTAYFGIRSWKAERFRFAIAYLLTFCLLLPIALLVSMGEFGIFSGLTRGRQDLELFYKFDDTFKQTTNAQLWWALLLSLPAYVWLRRFTQSSVFSLVFAAVAALFSQATLLRLGMLEWIDNDPGKVYLYLIPISLAYFVGAIAIEYSDRTSDSRYFYPFAVTFTFAALSGVAAYHEPYAKWLQSVAPWSRGQVEYLFIINAGIYLLLERICEQFHSSAQLRMVAKAFRFAIPGHVMTSLLLLGLEASSLWEKSPAQVAMRREARIFEVLLPIVACAFVFGSIPKQMKNFFASGLFFLAVGIVRLQQDFFRDRALWPIALILIGVSLLAASRYASARLLIARRFRRRS